MKICTNCKKKIYFWNSYHRKYPAIEYKKGKSKYVYFCSSDCAWKYIIKLDKNTKLKNE